MAAPDGYSEVLEIIKVLAAPCAVAVLGWWLRGQFNGVAKDAQTALGAHEEHDQERFEKIEEKSLERHEENLDRFEKIHTQLAQMNNSGYRH